MIRFTQLLFIVIVAPLLHLLWSCIFVFFQNCCCISLSFVLDTLLTILIRERVCLSRLFQISIQFQGFCHFKHDVAKSGTFYINILCVQCVCLKCSTKNHLNWPKCLHFIWEVSKKLKNQLNFDCLESQESSLCVTTSLLCWRHMKHARILVKVSDASEWSKQKVIFWEIKFAFKDGQSFVLQIGSTRSRWDCGQMLRRI